MGKGELKTLRITLEATDTGVLGYVYLRDIPAGAVAEMVALDGEDSVNADYDAQGKLLGLEFLDAQAADAQVMRRLAKRLGVPELTGIDLAEMCGAAAR